MLHLRVGSEHRDPAQAFSWAPRTTSGLAPSPIISLSAGPRPHHQPQGWPQATSPASGVAPGPQASCAGALPHRPGGAGLPRRPFPEPLSPLSRPSPLKRLRAHAPLSSQRDTRRTPGGRGESLLLLVRTAITQEAGTASLVRAGRAGKLKRGSRPPLCPRVECSPPNNAAHAQARGCGEQLGRPVLRQLASSLVARVRASTGSGACALRSKPQRGSGRGTTRRGGGLTVRPPVPATLRSPCSPLSAGRLSCCCPYPALSSEPPASRRGCVPPGDAALRAAPRRPRELPCRACAKASGAAGAGRARCRGAGGAEGRRPEARGRTEPSEAAAAQDGGQVLPLQRGQGLPGNGRAAGAGGPRLFPRRPRPPSGRGGPAPPPPPPAPSSSRPAGLCVRARRRVTTQRRERGGPGRAVKVTRGRGAAAGGLVTAVGRGESVPADGAAEGSPPLR